MPGALSLPPQALLRHYGGALLRLLLPTSCALCGTGSDEALCPACAAEFFGSASSAAAPRCPCCANPLPENRGQVCHFNTS